MPNLTRDECSALATASRAVTPSATPAPTLVIPLSIRLLADQLTPVLGYRRLVSGDERTAPSFLLESVEGGERQGRYSILGAQPALEVLARAHTVEVLTHRPIGSAPIDPTPRHADDPLLTLRDIASHLKLVLPPPGGGRPTLPGCTLGGWFGFAGYDTVRYAEPEKLATDRAPADDRNLPDLHFGFYDGIVVFDHVDKLVHTIQFALIGPSDDPGQAYDRAIDRLKQRIEQIQRHSKPLPAGIVDRETPAAPLPSNLTRDQHAAMVAKAQEYIKAGDIFQVVLGQRFERPSHADPFDVYRALRAVNPSPYMVYMQARGCLLIASSPEILCRVRHGAAPSPRATLDPGATARRGSASEPCPQPLILTNRPLAGTRRRGRTPDEDAALERELLSDHKERAEHIMLVDLGRNDVGKVSIPGTIALPRIMEIERYSHVMHISSTVTGELRPGLDCWDALRATLPVGTISGAPKIRAMQIIDELEPVRRGPYGGGMGYAGLDGQMDIALALRTIVVPTALRSPDGTWVYHLQAAGGIVADSVAQDEFQETVNKAAAMARAIDLAERAFGQG